MKISIIGAGAIGCLYGAKLEQAGADVQYIARGKHLEALKKNGLKISSPTGDIFIEKIKASSSISELNSPEICLVCVKMYDLADVCEELKKSIKQDTVVVLLQNGLESKSLASEYLPKNQIAEGFSITGARIEKPGEILHTSKNLGIYFEDLNETTRSFAKLCQTAGLTVESETNFTSLKWKKFVRLSPISTACCLARNHRSFVINDPLYLSLYRELIKETLNIAQALDIETFKDVDEVLEKSPIRAKDFKPSVYVDLERGRKLEIYWFCGAVHRIGAELEIPTPANSTAYAALKPFSNL